MNDSAKYWWPSVFPSMKISFQMFVFCIFSSHAISVLQSVIILQNWNCLSWLFNIPVRVLMKLNYESIRPVRRLKRENCIRIKDRLWIWNCGRLVLCYSILPKEMSASKLSNSRWKTNVSLVFGVRTRDEWMFKRSWERDLAISQWGKFLHCNVKVLQLL